MSHRSIGSIVLLFAAALAAAACASKPVSDYPVADVPLTSVKLDGGFWGGRQATDIAVSIAHSSGHRREHRPPDEAERADRADQEL